MEVFLGGRGGAGDAPLLPSRAWCVCLFGRFSKFREFVACNAMRVGERKLNTPYVSPFLFVAYCCPVLSRCGGGIARWKITISEILVFLGSVGVGEVFMPPWSICPDVNEPYG